MNDLVIYRIYGPVAAEKVFKKALRHVAKSGEVWCEGGRIYLNPCSRLFSPMNALKCLNYAIFFTPQYGDSFIEVWSFTNLFIHSLNYSIIHSIIHSFTL